MSRNGIKTYLESKAEINQVLGPAIHRISLVSAQSEIEVLLDSIHR